MLEFSFIGYKTQDHPMPATGEMIVTMEVDEIALGEMDATGGICARQSLPRRVWWRIGNLFR